MSSEGTGASPPLAVSALRNRFEQLAGEQSPSRPPLPLPQDSGRADPLPTPSINTNQYHNGPLKCAEPSNREFKQGRRPPPPPPRPLVSVAVNAPSSIPPSSDSPLSATQPLPNKSTLIARKPPPPPPISAAPYADDSTDGEGGKKSGVASLRSKFSAMPPPSLPSSRPSSAGNRVVSDSSLLTSNRDLMTPGISPNQQRNFTPTTTPLAPVFRFQSPDTPGVVAPRLPPRRAEPPPEQNYVDLGDDGYYVNGSSSDDTGRLAATVTANHGPPPVPPPRPPPRHSSLPPAQNETLSSDYDENESQSRSATLQVPPPLPARRSPPAATGSLPPRPPIRKTSLQDINPHRAPSAPPILLERKPTGIVPPPMRTIGIGEKLPPPRTPITPAFHDGSTSDEDEDEEPLTKASKSLELLPDTSNSSRRRPLLPSPAYINSCPPISAHTGVIAVAGPNVVISHHHIKVYNLSVSDAPLFHIDLKDIGVDWRVKEPRITSMEFRPAELAADRGRFLWLGTRDGTILELDVTSGEIASIRAAIHGSAITHIFRQSQHMVTLDESGKAFIFSPAESVGGYGGMLALEQPRVARIPDRLGFVKMMGGLLWASGGTGPGSTKTLGIRVYDILTHNTTVKSLTPLEPVGVALSGAILQTYPNLVFLGHEGGSISIWDRNSEDGIPICADVVKVSTSDILCLEGVHDRLWAGNRQGIISAYDVENRPWTVTNHWMAHSSLPVQKILVDPYSIEKSGRLAVVSVGRDEQVRFWDGLLGSDWIEGELMKRETQFSSFRPLNVLIVSWNIDAARPDALTDSAENISFLDNALRSVDSPDVIVFGFQELIDLESRKLAAKTAFLGSKKKQDGKISEKVSKSYKMWHDRLILAVRLAMPPDRPYTLVHTESLVGLFSCVFVKSSEQKGLGDVAITTVKRGIAGMYGNKGCIVARLVVNDSSLCFINCHLAAGQHHVRSRNADVSAILEEKEILPASADPERVAYVGGGDGTMVLDHEIVFLNGDLNYRIDMRREAVITAIQGGRLDQLLQHDQLLKEMKLNRGFRLRSFVEAPITFAPTYKYDRRSSAYDTSEKSRVPAWCDRILYNCRDPSRVRNLHYQRYEANVSDHRPISAGFAVTVKSVDHAKRAQLKEEVKGLWAAQQHLLLSAIQMFYVSEEII